MDTMKKIVKVVVAVWAAVIAGCLSGSAVEPLRVQNYEVELNMGVGSPLGGFRNTRGKIGVASELEVRRNFNGSKWDCGVRLGVYYNQYDFSSYADDNQTNQCFHIMATGGYNFRQGYKFNPYLGAGLGIGINDTKDGGNASDYHDIGGVMPVFMLRGGFELWRHIRIGAVMNVERRGFSMIGGEIAVVFGGSLKKTNP